MQMLPNKVKINGLRCYPLFIDSYIHKAKPYYMDRMSKQATSAKRNWFGGLQYVESGRTIFGIPQGGNCSLETRRHE